MYVILNDTLTALAPLIQKLQPFGSYFDTEKQLESEIHRTCKYLIANDLEMFVAQMRLGCRDKVCLNVGFAHPLAKALTGSVNILDFSGAQKSFSEVRNQVDFGSLPHEDLNALVDRVLRKVVIRYYYERAILPTVRPNALAFHEQSGPVTNRINYGYGFLSGYRPQLLGEYEHKQNMYWVRMLATEAVVHMIHDNFIDQENCRIFLPEDFANIEQKQLNHVDLFTDDLSAVHLCLLCSEELERGFAVPIDDLIILLKAFRLLDSYKLPRKRSM